MHSVALKSIPPPPPLKKRGKLEFNPERMSGGMRRGLTYPRAQPSMTQKCTSESNIARVGEWPEGVSDRGERKHARSGMAKCTR